MSRDHGKENGVNMTRASILRRPACFATTLAAILGSAVLLGCATSSHKSVRTYEYDDRPSGQRTSRPSETERVEDSGEWQMAAPGEMVVEPRRK
jgi:hypothetical protein